MGKTSLRATVRGRLFLCAIVAAATLLSSCGGGSAGEAEELKQGLAAQQSLDATVTGLTLVSETRVSRTVFDYVYRVTFTGGTVPADDVVATVVGVGAGTSVIDGEAKAGAVPALAVVQPTDTITLRHDRMRPFSLAAVRWSVAVRAVVDSVAITPGAITFTAIGQSMPISVKALDAAGREVSGAPVVVTSSAPEHIAVNTSAVFAKSDLGSSALVATSGNVSSAPVVASVVGVHPGTKVIADADVLTPLSDIATLNVEAGGTFTVRLRAGAAPAVDSLVVASGESHVSGRVVAVTANADGTNNVTVRTLPYEELYRRLNVDIRVPVEFLPDSTSIGGGTLRMRALAAGAARRPMKSFLGGLLKCESSGNFDVVKIPRSDVGLEVDDATWIHRLNLDKDKGVPLAMQMGTHARFTLSVDAELETQAVLTSGFRCESKAARLPVPGAYMPLVGGVQIPVQGLIGVDGKIAAGVAFRATGVYEVEGEIGIQKIGPIMLPWQNLVTKRREVQFGLAESVEPEVTISAYVGVGTGLELGNNVVTAGTILKMDALLKATSTYGSSAHVIGDDDFRAEDKVELLVSATPGGAETIAKFIQYYVKDFSSNDLTKTFRTLLDESPKLAKDATASVSAYAMGQVVRFDVDLDANELGFLTMSYNVKEVRIYKLVYDTADGFVVDAVPIATMTPSAEGATRFRGTWTATEAGKVTRPSGKPTFYAMVVPKFLGALRDLMPVELGPVKNSSSTLITFDDLNEGIYYLPAPYETDGYILRGQLTGEGEGLTVLIAPPVLSAALVYSGPPNYLSALRLGRADNDLFALEEVEVVFVRHEHPGEVDLRLVIVGTDADGQEVTRKVLDTLKPGEVRRHHLVFGPEWSNLRSVLMHSDYYSDPLAPGGGAYVTNIKLRRRHEAGNVQR